MTIKDIFANPFGYTVKSKEVILCQYVRLSKAEKEKISMPDDYDDFLPMCYNMTTGEYVYAADVGGAPSTDLRFFLDGDNVVITEEGNLFGKDYSEYCLIANNKGNELGFYFEVIDNHLVISLWYFDRKKAYKKNYGETRSWKLNSLVVFNKEKECWVPSYDAIQNKTTMHRYDSWKTLIHPFEFSLMDNAKSINGELFSSYAQPAADFFGEFVYMAANRVTRILDNPYYFEEFILYSEPKKRSGPSQKMIDELVAIPLPDVKFDDSFVSDNKFNRQIAVIQKVKEGVCVLRTLFYDEQTKKMGDSARIYIFKNKYVACRPTNKGFWISMSLKTTSRYNWNFDICSVDAEATKGTMLEYFPEIINRYSDNDKSVLIASLLAYPELEKLDKLGLHHFIDVEIHTYSSRDSYLRNIFGKLNKSNKLTNALGLNKFQLQVFIQAYKERFEKFPDDQKAYPASFRYDIIKYVKKIFQNNEQNITNSWHTWAWSFVVPDNSLSDIDNETFMKVWNFVDMFYDDMDSYAYSWEKETIFACLNAVVILYGVQSMLKVIDDMQKAGLKNHCYSSYMDYLNMVKQYDLGNAFKPYFSSAQDIIIMHDNLVALVNSMRDSLYQKKLDSYKAKWEKLLYEDENFMIRYPEEASEIATEGITLHHCVKTYIPKVINGITNILFIRKKDDPDTPFFTTEVSNKNMVIQVHGSCNRSQSTEPGLREFLDKWEKACHLTEGNIDGYGI